MTPLVPLFVIGMLCPAQPPDEATRTLEKAIAAHKEPADDVMVKITSSVKLRRGGKTATTGKQVMLSGTDGRYREEFTLHNWWGTTTSVVVVDGKNSWATTNGRPQESNAFDDAIYLSQVMTLKVLTDRTRFQLEPLPPATVDGEKCVGLRVKASGRNDVDLTFSEATGLQRKFATRVTASDGQVRPVVNVLSDYRVFGGVPLATRTLATVGGDLVVNEYAIESVGFVPADKAAPLFVKP